jgi:hypothetical protein
MLNIFYIIVDKNSGLVNQNPLKIALMLQLIFRSLGFVIGRILIFGAFIISSNGETYGYFLWLPLSLIADSYVRVDPL